MLDPYLVAMTQPHQQPLGQLRAPGDRLQLGEQLRPFQRPGTAQAFRALCQKPAAMPPLQAARPS